MRPWADAAPRGLIKACRGAFDATRAGDAARAADRPMRRPWWSVAAIRARRQWAVRRRPRPGVVIGAPAASSEGARGPRDVIRSACAWKHIFESTSYIFEAAGWAARGCVRTRCHLAESICACRAGRGRLTRRRRAELPSSCWPCAEPRAPRSTRIERLSTRSHKPVDAACESTARDKVQSA